MSEAGITLWHASRSDVERPTIAGRTEGENHDNSGLGIYCATGPHDYIDGFGDSIHSLVMRPDVRIMEMSIEDLRLMGSQGSDIEDGRDRAWFEAEGRRLAARFDVVLIREDNGYASQAVILTDDAIASSIRMTRDEFAAISTNVFREMKAFEAENEDSLMREGRAAYGRVRPRGRAEPVTPMSTRSRSR
jgi:hypothetical protein